MSTVQVFDPPMCCSTGICGPEVDSRLVEFAADLDWLASQGITVRRFNLAQEPMRFAETAAVKAMLERSTEDELPAIVVDGVVAASGRYPSRDELARWAGLVHEASLFTEQVAELVAIGAAIASNCEPCFRFHYDKARKLGVTAGDVRRAVDLAQQVKEAPARAVLNLAHRYLDTKDPLSAVSVVAASAPQTQGACCAPAPAAAGASRCC